jgi:serine protease Do
MEDKQQYNKFIKHPLNSNLLMNASLVIGFIILIISQFALFRTMTQERTGSSSNGKEVQDNDTGSELILTSSDITLVSCSDDDLSDAVARIRPSVVNIDVTSSGASSPSGRRGQALNFDMPSQQALKTNDETLGSGIIVDGRGYILTCYHLVKDSPLVYVTVFTSNRKSYKADIIGVDAEEDLAVLKISPDERLPTARLGNSDLIKITDTVLTIGSPFGFEHTVTEGVVSDDKRSLIIDGKLYGDLFQTDASINRGSAGGALIDTEGEVIGVNTAIVSGSDYFSGISFAIPINKARALLFKVIES